MSQQVPRAVDGGRSHLLVAKLTTITTKKKKLKMVSGKRRSTAGDPVPCLEAKLLES